MIDTFALEFLLRSAKGLWLVGGLPASRFSNWVKTKNPAVCAGFILEEGCVESYSTDIPNIRGEGF